VRLPAPSPWASRHLTVNAALSLGPPCTSSPIERVNCELRYVGEVLALRWQRRLTALLSCVSDSCYEHIYGSDPVSLLQLVPALLTAAQLEEGEIDTYRGRSFHACARACVPAASARSRS